MIRLKIWKEFGCGCAASFVNTTPICQGGVASKLWAQLWIPNIEGRRDSVIMILFFCIFYLLLTILHTKLLLPWLNILTCYARQLVLTCTSNINYQKYRHFFLQLEYTAPKPIHTHLIGVKRVARPSHPVGLHLSFWIYTIHQRLAQQTAQSPVPYVSANPYQKVTWAWKEWNFLLGKLFILLHETRIKNVTHFQIKWLSSGSCIYIYKH